MKVTAVQVDPHEKTIHGDQALLGMGGSVPNGVHPSVLAQPMICPVPEGRVHGGGLLALLSQGGSSTSAGGSVFQARYPGCEGRVLQEIGSLQF